MLRRNFEPSSKLLPAMTRSAKVENDSEDNILELTTFQKSWFSQKGGKKHLRNSFINIVKVKPGAQKRSLFIFAQFATVGSRKEVSKEMTCSSSGIFVFMKKAVAYS